MATANQDGSASCGPFADPAISDYINSRFKQVNWKDLIDVILKAIETGGFTLVNDAYGNQKFGVRCTGVDLTQEENIDCLAYVRWMRSTTPYQFPCDGVIYDWFVRSALPQRCEFVEGSSFDWILDLIYFPGLQVPVP